MSQTSEITPRKAQFKDYLVYATLGGIIHPIAGIAFSFVLAGLETLYYYYSSNSIGPFTFIALLGVSPLGIFVSLPMFVTAGAIYSILFGLIYNATAHGKANSVSNRILYNIVFSCVMGVVGPIVVVVLFQFSPYLVSS